MNGVELYKTANAQTSLICEANLGFVGKDNKVHDKIVLTLVLRNDQNKAIKTMRFYLDIPAAKVLFHDLWQGKLTEEYKEFKKGANWERALSITKHESEGYRVSIMNSNSNGERDRLYFPLSFLHARQLAITVLDYLRTYELAKALADFQKGNLSPMDNGDISNA